MTRPARMANSVAGWGRALPTLSTAPRKRVNHEGRAAEVQSDVIKEAAFRRKGVVENPSRYKANRGRGDRDNRERAPRGPFRQSTAIYLQGVSPSIT